MGKGPKGRGAREPRNSGGQPNKQDAAKAAARLQAQKTRLQRALSKAQAMPADADGSNAKRKALLAVHEDGAKTYREYDSVARGGEEWVQAERLKHLQAIFDLEPDGPLALALRDEFVLTLLDEGEAATARKVLEGLDAESMARAVLAWSMALVEVVAWKGQEEGASEEVCAAAVDKALKANTYIGIFLSNLDCYTREIDPTHAPPLEKRGAGTVEEALAYTALAAGCWMDFDEDGSVCGLVGGRLEEVEVEWPPVSEGKTEKFRRQFEEATAIAEKEAEEASEDEEGEGGEEEGQGAEEEEEEEEKEEEEEEEEEKQPKKKSRRR